jgi:guanyl-specific ribonuclease Sa
MRMRAALFAGLCAAALACWRMAPAREQASVAAETSNELRRPAGAASSSARDRRGAELPRRRTVENVRLESERGSVLYVGEVDLAPTLERIARGERNPHRNDGSVFQNRPLPGKATPELPRKPPGYYQEYVHPTPGLSGPGPQRIVVGRGGEWYYTPDHYQSFVLLE